MRKRNGLFALILCLCLPIQARILRVNNTPNIEAGYTSIENALIDAAAGDTIYLEPSSQAYGTRDAFDYHDLHINKPVTIVGPGYFLADNKVTEFASGESFIGGVIHVSAPNTSISGIIMAQVRIEANDITLDRCQILAGSGNAIKVRDSVNGAVIERCFIVGDIVGQNYPHNVMVNNNIICGDVETFERSRIEHNTFGRYNHFGSVRDLRFCTVVENIMENQSKGKNLSTTAFVNNFVGDFSPFMQQVDFTHDANYRIKLGAPLSTQSSDGGPIGAFGGAMPYVVSGLPDFPVISNITGPTSVNSYQGLPVTVTYKLDR